MPNTRRTWRTRSGFYFVALGSALGLGNLWRFPYVVGENGGGAFILLYLLMAFVLGAPLLIGELILGQKTKKSVILSTRSVLKENLKSKFKFTWIGKVTVVLSFVVLSYYSVISGWVLHFLTHSVFIFFNPFSVDHSTLDFLIQHGSLQWALASVHLILASFIVGKGVQEGVEKWSGYVMPVFLLLVMLLVIKALSLPSAPDVLRFLFYPDFSKLKWSSLIHAIGQVLFTLSVGFGTLVTFGSYMNVEESIPTAGFRISIIDIFLSLISVLMIFPIAFQASDIPLTDPTLLFEVLPKFLLSIKGGELFGFLFFLCLYLASLNATVGLLEGIVSNFVDLQKKEDRSKASMLAGAGVLILTIVPSLSSTLLRKMIFNEKSLIETMDSLLINWLLPIAAVGLAWMVGHYISEKELKKYFDHEKNVISQAVYPHWLFMIKWMAPFFILLGLFLELIGLIKNLIQQ